MSIRRRGGHLKKKPEEASGKKRVSSGARRSGTAAGVERDSLQGGAASVEDGFRVVFSSES